MHASHFGEYNRLRDILSYVSYIKDFNMLATHRPWSNGYQAYHIPPHHGGVAEGWIGTPSTTLQQPSTVWLQVQWVPKFEHPVNQVYMTYNGQKLPPCNMYDAPCVSEVSIVVDRDAHGWLKGDVLGCMSFPYHTDDVALIVEEKKGQCLINGQPENPLYFVGGVCGKGILLHMAAYFPQMNSLRQTVVRGRSKEVSAWGRKKDHKPLTTWIKQGGITINHNGKVWTSSDVEEFQYPSYRVCLRSTS